MEDPYVIMDLLKILEIIVGSLLIILYILFLQIFEAWVVASENKA